MPRKLSVGPLMVAFGGVVVDDVENHLDAGAVQRARPSPGTRQSAPAGSARLEYPACGAKNPIEL